MHASELASLRGEIALRVCGRQRRRGGGSRRAGAGDRLSDRLSDRQARRTEARSSTRDGTRDGTRPRDDTRPRPRSIFADGCRPRGARGGGGSDASLAEGRGEGARVGGDGDHRRGNLERGVHPRFLPREAAARAGRQSGRRGPSSAPIDPANRSANRPGRPRAPPSLAGSERSTRSRSGTAAAVAAAVRAGGARAVDALLASGEFEPDETAPRPSPFPGAPGHALAQPRRASRSRGAARHARTR